MRAYSQQSLASFVNSFFSHFSSSLLVFLFKNPTFIGQVFIAINIFIIKEKQTSFEIIFIRINIIPNEKEH